MFCNDLFWLIFGIGCLWLIKVITDKICCLLKQIKYDLPLEELKSKQEFECKLNERKEGIEAELRKDNKERLNKGEIKDLKEERDKLKIEKERLETELQWYKNHVVAVKDLIDKNTQLE